MTDEMFNLSWESIGLSMGGDQMTPELERAMKSQSFAELFELILKATEQKPDKLMQAAFYHQINMIQSKNDPNYCSDKDYRDLVMNHARSLLSLTRVGGSPDSIWADVNELAQWLASKAHRPLPDSEDSTTTELYYFAKYAIGGFIPPFPQELVSQGNIIDFTFTLASYSSGTAETSQVEEGWVGGVGRLTLKKAGYEQRVSFAFNKTGYSPDLGTIEGEVTVVRVVKDATGEKTYPPEVIRWHGRKSGNARIFEVGDIIEGTFDEEFDIFPKYFSFSLTIG
jgi:hypothetical protein